jgi:hypothetical protein
LAVCPNDITGAQTGTYVTGGGVLFVCGQLSVRALFFFLSGIALLGCSGYFVYFVNGSLAVCPNDITGAQTGTYVTGGGVPFACGQLSVRALFFFLSGIAGLGLRGYLVYFVNGSLAVCPNDITGAQIGIYVTGGGVLFVGGQLSVRALFFFLSGIALLGHRGY